MQMMAHLLAAIAAYRMELDRTHMLLGVVFTSSAKPDGRTLRFNSVEDVSYSSLVFRLPHKGTLQQDTLSINQGKN